MPAVISQINIELSSRCDKACYFCGHQNPKINPAPQGDIELKVLASIAEELPEGCVVQFHRDGEPLVYPFLREALALFEGHVRSVVTNGKKLRAWTDALAQNCESVCISAFKGDPDGSEQDGELVEFVEQLSRRDSPCQVLVKVVGGIEEYRRKLWESLVIPVIERRLHIPQASRRYRDGAPTRPEHGICADLLHHPSVSWTGDVFICNRLDPARKGLIGNVQNETLEDILGGERRRSYIELHARGRRDACDPCAGCEYWGVPNAP